MESTLALPKKDLQVKAAKYLGWGRGAANGDTAYDAEELDYLKDFMDSCCRRVYKAAIDGKTYDWSWLRPVRPVTLASGTSLLALPDDFGGLDGDLTLVPNAGLWVQPIRITNEQLVREAQANSPTQTGRPQMAAVRWEAGTGVNRGQRASLVFFPQADQDYQLNVAYYVLPDALTDAFPYALGGAGMTETYLEGILAVAEQRLDDIDEDSPASVHGKAFKRELASAIDQDRRYKMQNLGYNRDRSDERDQYWGGRWRDQTQAVTFNGVTYGPA